MSLRKTPRNSAGDRIPQAQLGRLVNGAIELVSLHELLSAKRAVVVGVPGAFTPVCTCEHVPDLLGGVDRLRASGMDYVICVAPNDPWAVEAWAERVDPHNKLMFLSDGNLALARALGVTVIDRENVQGETQARYMMIAGKGVVQRLNVEPVRNKLTCTRSEDVVFID
jgi:2-Cys peroxiredoxin 5